MEACDLCAVSMMLAYLAQYFHKSWPPHCRCSSAAGSCSLPAQCSCRWRENEISKERAEFDPSVCKTEGLYSVHSVKLKHLQFDLCSELKLSFKEEV